MALDSMSARRPSPRRPASMSVSMMSPTARMSAAVSTSTTMITISIEKMAAK